MCYSYRKQIKTSKLFLIIKDFREEGKVMRKIINVNSNWKFVRQNEKKAYDKFHNEKNWETVNIPHTWNAIDGADGSDFYKGACWYRKAFQLDTVLEGRKIFIEFNGSNSITDVYVNEQHIGQHKGGYSTFRFDITNAVKFGAENLLAVKVDNTIVDDVYPQKADFTFYGGIYRDVNIIATDNVHFDLMDYGSNGIYIMQNEVDCDKAKLQIKAKLVNEYAEDKKVRLWVEIFNAEETVVTYTASEVNLSAEACTNVEIPLEILSPVLWNGRKNPYMYQAKVSISNYNDTADELIIPFGVRFFNVDSEKGFFLNDEHLSLNGVSRHQDRKDMGWAITQKEQVEDMELIKEIGANSIRLAHYQHNSFFYDLCDQEGMVVWAEIPFISIMSKTELEGINAKQQMIELIRQNYNHPSIFFWGIQNEIQIGGDRSEVKKVVKELNELTKREDPTRLSTMANVTFLKDTDEYHYITDVIGLNKYFGWYHGKAEDFANWIDEFHNTNPQVSLCISEYGAEGIVKYHSSKPTIKDYTEEYHTLYHEKVWKIMEERQFLWATYVWNMFDFGANIRDEGGVKGRNNKGLITYDRKIKKDAFYMYKAHWSDEKFVHIAEKRFFEREEEKIKVKVYSNCEKVTLYVNEIEKELIVGTDKVFIFEGVLLLKGMNTIKAVGCQDEVLFEDTARFLKVSKSNPNYHAPVEDVGSEVENWFEMPDLSNVVVEELEITDDVYSTRCTYREIIENEETRAIFKKYFGNQDEHPMFSMLLGMKIDTVAAMDADQFDEKKMYMFNKELIQIKKGINFNN